MFRSAVAVLFGVAVAFSVGFPAGDSDDEEALFRPLSADPEPTPAMQTALASWIDVRFQATPFEAAVASLSKQVGVSIVVDPLLVGKNSVKLDHPVSFELQRVRLLSALEVLGRRFDLIADVRPDFIMLVERGEDKTNVRRAYPAPDLLLDRNGKWIDYASSWLIALLQDCVERDVWEPNGGDATIMFHPSSMTLMVNAPRPVQQKVAEAFGLLRRGRDQTRRWIALRQTAPLEQVLSELERAYADPPAVVPP
jgi:hypothetical protein